MQYTSGNTCMIYVFHNTWCCVLFTESAMTEWDHTRKPNLKIPKVDVESGLQEYTRWLVITGIVSIVSRCVKYSVAFTFRSAYVCFRPCPSSAAKRSSRLWNSTKFTGNIWKYPRKHCSNSQKQQSPQQTKNIRCILLSPSYFQGININIVQ